jgi:hypothetical protein
MIGGAVVVLLAVMAGGYYFVFGRSPEPAPTPPPPVATPAATPTVAPTPALSAPATVDGAPTTAPTITPGETPTPATAPTATPVATTPPAAPTPTPATAVAPPAPTAPPPTGEPLALLRQGALDEAARGFAASLAAGPQDRYAVQALVACSPETVMKAVQAVPGDDLFILPVDYKGRACHRICWGGVYPDRAAAEAAARSFPAYFRQNNIRPRIQPVADLLP